jgi:hypothetical protein
VVTGQRLEGDLDIDGQAGGADFVGFQAVREPTVGVLVAAQRVYHSGGVGALEEGGEQPPFQEPPLTADEFAGGGEGGVGHGVMDSGGSPPRARARPTLRIRDGGLEEVGPPSSRDD